MGRIQDAQLRRTLCRDAEARVYFRRAQHPSVGAAARNWLPGLCNREVNRGRRETRNIAAGARSLLADESGRGLGENRLPAGSCDSEPASEWNQIPGGLPADLYSRDDGAASLGARATA